MQRTWIGMTRGKVAALLLLIGGLLSFVVWTVPTWPLFQQLLAQWSALWQVPGNRLIMIRIVLKFCAPLVVGAILAGCCWVAEATWQEVEARRSARHRSGSTSRGLTTFPAPSAAAPSAEMSVWSNSGRDPVTPMPEFGPVFEVAPASHDEALHVPAVVPEEPSATIQNSEAQEPASSLSVTASDVDTDPGIELTLLGELGICVRAADGRRFPFTPGWSTREMQLVAYIAWRQGEKVELNDLREEVFGWGVPDEQATLPRLQEALSSTKKAVRKKLAEALRCLNEQAGSVVLSEDSDLFVVANKQYALAPHVRVVDLARLDAAYRVIGQATQDTVLGEEVQHACQAFLEAYTSDVLAKAIPSVASAGEEWSDHWMQVPFTLYRDRVLQARWYRAEWFRSRAGQVSPGPEQVALYDQAAQHYLAYALHAVGSRFDRKKRRGTGEQALRYCLRMYAHTGNTHGATLAYQAFADLVHEVFPEWAWKPSEKTRLAWGQVQGLTDQHAPVDPPPVATREG